MPNSSKAETNLACHLCDTVLGSAKNLRRHKKTVHNLHAPIAAVRVKREDCQFGGWNYSAHWNGSR